MLCVQLWRMLRTALALGDARFGRVFTRAVVARADHAGGPPCNGRADGRAMPISACGPALSARAAPPRAPPGKTVAHPGPPGRVNWYRTCTAHWPDDDGCAQKAKKAIKSEKQKDRPPPLRTGLRAAATGPRRTPHAKRAENAIKPARRTATPGQYGNWDPSRGRGGGAGGALGPGGPGGGGPGGTPRPRARRAPATQVPTGTL